MDATPKPILEIVPPERGGGFRVSFPDIPFAGSGASIEAAIQDLARRLRALQTGEKGELIDDVEYQERLAEDDPFLKRRYADYAESLLRGDLGSSFYPYGSI